MEAARPVDRGRSGCSMSQDRRMPRTIDVSDALSLLRSRDDLRARGCTERDIESMVRDGLLRRVRRGRYIAEDDWRDLWNEGRHLVEVVATYLNSAPPGPVFVGASAAVLHGLPLYRLAPGKVHVAIAGARHSRTRAGVAWHDVDVPLTDVAAVDGIRCTSMDRTVLDVASALPPEAAISVADAALRSEAVMMHVQDADAAADWTDRLSRRADRLHSRGIRQARRIIAFADGRAQLPGESVSRLMLATLGYAQPDLQVHVVGPEGEDYWLDFGFRRSRAFGEFDGTGKYFDDELRGSRTPQEVVFAEKAREDAIRGVTGWGLVRWGSVHLATLDRFAARLRAFGIRPPG